MAVHGDATGPVFLVLPASGSGGVEARRAFEEVFHRYFPRVRKFFRKRSFSDQEAMELTQDTFLRVFRVGGRFDTEEHLEAWLFEIAANHYRNTVRGRNSRKRRGREDSLEGLMEEEAPGRLARKARKAVSVSEAQENAVFERECRERIAEALLELPDQMRRCIRLRLYHDLKYEEIARVMRIETDTVKAHLYQARNRLRVLLAPHFDDVDF